MRDQAGGSVTDPTAHSDQAAGLLNCWHSYNGKWLHGTPLILRHSVRLLLAHIEGPSPANRATLQRDTTCPQPDATEPVCILG